MGTRSTWLIALTGTFILTLSLADIAATKFIVFSGVVAPGGVFLFAIIFVVRDMLHKTAGAAYVRQTIAVAAALNVAVAIYLFWIARLPAPGFYELAEPWQAIFSLAPAIVTGSIIAAVVSQLVNTSIYQWLWNRGRAQWERSVGSNLVSLTVDSLLFTGIAFVILPPLLGAEPISLEDALVRVASGQTLIKLVIMLAMTPLLYLVPSNPDLEPARAA
jgi:uncharacterized integral membrane protein (TIGR00697 family)